MRANKEKKIPRKKNNLARVVFNFIQLGRKPEVAH